MPYRAFDLLAASRTVSRSTWWSRTNCLIGVLVDIGADGEDDDLVAHIFLQVDQGGHLLDAGRAPGGPEVQDDRFTSQVMQRNRVLRVGYGELRGFRPDLSRAGALVATSEKQGEQQRNEML